MGNSGGPCAAQKEGLAIKLEHICIAALLGAAAASIAPAAALERNVMVTRLAKDTGWTPAEVVFALGDRWDVVETNYYARKSMRGYLAKVTAQVYAQWLAVQADGGDRTAVVGQPPEGIAVG